MRILLSEDASSDRSSFLPVCPDAAAAAAAVAATGDDGSLSWDEVKHMKPSAALRPSSDAKDLLQIQTHDYYYYYYSYYHVYSLNFRLVEIFFIVSTLLIHTTGIFSDESVLPKVFVVTFSRF